MNYSELLKDPRWQKKRLEILERDNWECVLCGDGEKTLHVHHLCYKKKPWSVKNNHLVTLCKDCHKKETEKLNEALYLLTSAAKKKLSVINILALAEFMEAGNIKYSDTEETFYSIQAFFKSKKIRKELAEGCIQEIEDGEKIHRYNNMDTEQMV